MGSRALQDTLIDFQTASDPMPQALLTSSIMDDDHPHHKQAPCFIAEVLLPATAATDVREKWLSYQRLPSLRYYLQVDSERVWAQCHVRLPDDQWDPLAPQADDRPDVQCGDASLSLCLDDLYEDTDLLPH